LGLHLSADLPDAAGPRPRGGGAQDHSAKRALRVLVVDDDRDSVLTLMTLLKEEGYEPHGVYAGRYVMGSVIDLNPDVIILDINLADRNGWEIARVIRSQRGRERLTLIGVSGHYTDAADQARARITGFDHYFLKPYDPADLLRVLASVKNRS
jgi:DNA-binding response OmpR family regulator